MRSRRPGSYLSSIPRPAGSGLVRLRPKALVGLETWIEDRFRRHAGNVDVLRQELSAEKGIEVSLRTVERAVAHQRRRTLRVSQGNP